LKYRMLGGLWRRDGKFGNYLYTPRAILMSE
jgi:hypothetical protein